MRPQRVVLANVGKHGIRSLQYGTVGRGIVQYCGAVLLSCAAQRNRLTVCSEGGRAAVQVHEQVLREQGTIIRRVVGS